MVQGHPFYGYLHDLITQRRIHQHQKIYRREIAKKYLIDKPPPEKRRQLGHNLRQLTVLQQPLLPPQILIVIDQLILQIRVDILQNQIPVNREELPQVENAILAKLVQKDDDLFENVGEHDGGEDEEESYEDCLVGVFGGVVAVGDGREGLDGVVHGVHVLHVPRF